MNNLGSAKVVLGIVFVIGWTELAAAGVIFDAPPTAPGPVDEAITVGSIPPFPQEPLRRYAIVGELVIQDTAYKSEFVLAAGFRLKPDFPFTLTHDFNIGEDWEVTGTLSVSGDIVKGEFLHLTDLRYFHNNAPHGEPPFHVAFDPIFNIGAGSGQFDDVKGPDDQFFAFGSRAFSLRELHPGAPHSEKDVFNVRVDWTGRGDPITPFGPIATFSHITVRYTSAHVPEPSSLLVLNGLLGLSGLGAGVRHQLRRRRGRSPLY